MNLNILRATPEDAETIVRLIRQVWQETEYKEWFVIDQPEYTYGLIHQSTGWGYKAVNQETGEIGGCFIVTFPGNSEENLGVDGGLKESQLSRVAHMDTVAVLPAYRGQGLQYRLMEAGEKDLAKAGYEYLMCTVHPDNQFSRNNVLGQGYDIVDTKEKYGGYLRDIYLKKL